MGIGAFFSDLASDVRDAGASLLGLDSSETNAAQARAAQAKQAGQAERQRLAQNNAHLQAAHGVDPPSITRHENWRAMSHQQIYDTNQRSLNEGHADAVGTGWENVGKKLAELGDRLQKRSVKAIESGWEGQAAEAAKQSSKPDADWARNSGETFRLTGGKIKQAGSAAGQAKAMIPKPPDTDWSELGVTTAINPIAGGINYFQQQQAQDEAERHAQDTMGRVLSGTYAEVDRSVPAYKHMDGQDATPPPQEDLPESPAVPRPIVPGYNDGGGNSGTNYTGNNHPGNNYSASNYSASNYSGRDYAQGNTSLPNSNSASNPPGYNASNSSGTQDGPASSSSAWYPGTPGAPGVPGPATAGPGTPGGVRPGAPNAPGVGGGLVAGGPGGGQAGGRAGSGAGRSNTLGPGGKSGTGSTTGKPGAAPSNTASTSSASSRAGRMPMGAMGANRGQNGGEDEEHERPSWLQEWDDVWLDNMPPTAPPVIGE